MHGRVDKPGGHSVHLGGNQRRTLESHHNVKTQSKNGING